MFVKTGVISKMVYLERVGHAPLKQGGGQVLGVGVRCFETMFEHDQEKGNQCCCSAALRGWCQVFLKPHSNTTKRTGLEAHAAPRHSSCSTSTLRAKLGYSDNSARTATIGSQLNIIETRGCSGKLHTASPRDVACVRGRGTLSLLSVSPLARADSIVSR